MDENLELLNYIYQNAQMGQDTLTKLLKIVENQGIAALLEKQRDEYKAIFDESDKAINQLDREPKGLGKMEELSTYLMLNLQTLTDKTPEHIAEMVMQGSVMGIIDIVRNLRKYQGADRQSLALGERLLALEEHNLQECKKFL